MNDYPAETIEFVHVPVTVDGQPVTTSVSYSVTPQPPGQPTARPTTWEPALLLAGKTGFMLGDYPPGLLQVWAKVDSDPEHPVIDCGQVRIRG